MYTTFLQIGLASFISLSTLGAQFSPNLSPGLAGAALELLGDQPVIVQDAQLASVISIEDLIEVKARIKGVDPEILKKIAFCESNMRQYNTKGQVLRGLENNLDVGVFQINEGYYLKQSKDQGLDIHKTEDNINWAIYLFERDGERHWNASRVCWTKPKTS